MISSCDYSGIEFTSSSYNNVTGNTITDSAGGIYTYSSYENTFAANSISDNTNGITLDGSNGVLTGNVLTGNNVGIYLKYCTDTVLWLNRLSNTLNFKIDGTGINYWNSSTLRGYDYNGNHFVSYVGNYWSDYSGPDSDNNGIIDTRPHAGIRQRRQVPGAPGIPRDHYACRGPARGGVQRSLGYGQRGHHRPHHAAPHRRHERLFVCQGLVHRRHRYPGRELHVRQRDDHLRADQADSGFDVACLRTASSSQPTPM